MAMSLIGLSCTNDEEVATYNRVVKSINTEGLLGARFACYSGARELRTGATKLQITDVNTSKQGGAPIPHV